MVRFTMAYMVRFTMAYMEVLESDDAHDSTEAGKMTGLQATTLSELAARTGATDDQLTQAVDKLVKAALLSQASNSPQMRELPKLIYTVQEACQILHIGRTTLWKLVKTKQLKPFYIGRRPFFTLQALQDFISSPTRRK
jgi:excisionase family DNA binding protein